MRHCNLQITKAPLRATLHKTSVKAPSRVMVQKSAPKRGVSTMAMVVPYIPYVGAAAAGTAVLAYAATRYKVAAPDEYIVKTGLAISDISVSKKTVQWPFQTVSYINLKPINYEFSLQAMTIEKLEFMLPGVFTVGPKPDQEHLIKYARTLINEKSLEKNILSILEGETRVLAAKLTVEEIFNDRKAFKDTIIKAVEDELAQYGLMIYNANIKELHDSPGSEYFSFVRQKKKSQAENAAKVEVSEAKKQGDIGQKEREALTRQQVAQYEADTVTKENERKQQIEKSSAELEVIRAEAIEKSKVAHVQADMKVKQRQIELEKELEMKRIGTQTERMRAEKMSKAQVEAEVHIKDSEGKAAAIRIEAEAQLYAAQKQAEAQLCTAQKQAEGIYAIYKAQSDGLNSLNKSFNSDQTLIQYLMMEKGLYERLAEKNAQALQGLAPKITIWSTGEMSDYTKPIAEIGKMIPPLVQTIHDQTGISPADWIFKMGKKDDNSSK